MLEIIKNNLLKLKKLLFHDIKHAWFATYYLVVFWQFNLIEKHNANTKTMISFKPIDNLIPFISFFVVFYLIWFVYVGVTVTTLVFTDKYDFYKLLFNIYIGMSICFIFFLVYPHGQDLRAHLTAHETNIFDRMVYTVYSCDNPADTAPSIHVLNSIAVTMAITRSEFFRKRYGFIIAAQILNVLIIVSTLFIKQHSIIDVILAIGLSIIMQFFIYKINWNKFFIKSRQKIRI